MSLNIKIIEGVQQFPILYDNKYSIEDRNQAWLELAEKLQMNDKDLKIRWHCLLRRYLHEEDFRYANKMKFLQLNNTNQVKVENWPEFIITEDDLKDNRPEDNEGFHCFVETTEENNALKELKTEDNAEKEFQYQNGNAVEFSKDRNERDTSVSKSTIQETTSKHHNKLQIQVVKGIAKDFAENPTNMVAKMDDINMRNSNMEQKSDEETVNEESVCENKNKIPAIETPKEVSVDHNAKPQRQLQLQSQPQPQPFTERCEDVIFGELVSAMLKRMDESKKNNIKKEIMNLLFS